MLTDFDKKLLNIIQQAIPLDCRPFAVIAAELGVDELTVIERLRYLKESGYIRRLGAFFNSDKLGYVSTLVVLQVERDYLRSVAETINRFPGVTHNYEREARENLWFTLLSADEESQDEVLAKIGGLPGVKLLRSLPSIRKHKINVQFSLK